MKEITQILGQKMCNGFLVNTTKTYLLCDPPRDIFAETHKEFSRDEKKLAKARYKANQY